MDRKYTVIIPLEKLDDASLNTAYRLFNSFKDNGTILNSKWESNTWFLTDEKENVTFNFEIDSNKKIFYGMKKKEFIEYIKAYTCYILGYKSLKLIRLLIKTIIDLSLKNYNAIKPWEGITNVEDFLSMLPVENSKELDDAYEYLYEIVFEKEERESRELAAFESYFKFDEILNKYWGEEDDVFKKLYYFPIYLWWKITSVLPLRPIEFILTPRDCLKCIDGKYFIKIKRNKLKGHNKIHTYSISGDYDECEYEIPIKIAKEIQWYLRHTENMQISSNNTLFVIEPHYKKYNMNPSINNSYITYHCFNAILRNYYREILCQKYGYEIIYNKTIKFLNSNQIQYINLGDTRHLSLINIIAEGGSPIIAMELARHKNINITFSYAANIEKLVQCKAFRYLKGIKGYKISYPIQKIVSKKYIMIGKNMCCSEKTISGNYEDCSKAFGENGETGNCESCPYSRDTIQKYSGNNNIERDVQMLIYTINKVRKNKGDSEEILSAFSKLGTSSYQEYKKILERGEIYGE